MTIDPKLEERSESDASRQGHPQTLADRIERFQHALNARQLSDLLRVSRITIFKLAKAGRMPSFRIGTCVRFDPRAVANWLRSQ
jgi:excisionase family DNA binding protein